MSNPSILILDRLADGRIGVDEAVRRLRLIRVSHSSHRRSGIRIPAPPAPTAPSYFDGVTAERLN